MNILVYLLGCFLLVIASAYMARFFSKIVKKSIEIPTFLLLMTVIFGPGVYAHSDWEKHCSAANMQIHSVAPVTSFYSEMLAATEAEYLLRKGYIVIETRNHSYTELQYPVKKYEVEENNRITSELTKLSVTRYKIVERREMLSDSLEVSEYRAVDSYDDNKLLGVHKNYINHGGFLWRWATRVAREGGSEPCPDNTTIIDFILTIFPSKS